MKNKIPFKSCETGKKDSSSYYCKKNIIIIISIILIIFGGYFLYDKFFGYEKISNELEEKLIDNTQKTSSNLVDKNNESKKIDKVTIKSGEMLDFSEEQVIKSLKENKTVILLFLAEWCPSCRLFEKDIIKNLQNIPEDVVLLKADYDKQKALKQKYEIIMQHTLVQIDKNQEIVKKWSGSPTLESLISEIQ